MDDRVCHFHHENVLKLQENVSQSITYKKSIIPQIKKWNKYTVEIPSTENRTEAFKRHYLSKVIDKNTLENLEDEKIINTNPKLAKLYSVITPADGNCLCHAVSLYLWGIPDREYFLRRVLYITMVTDENKLLQRLYMQHVANQQLPEESFNSKIWTKQWDTLVAQTQEIPANLGSTQLEPLEAIHIFILANILLRPIIVLSSPVVRTVFDQTIQANNISGIYLPLLCNPDETEKSPIVLGFHMNHFTPLMYMENEVLRKPALLKQIPLTSLPVHFCQDSLTNNIVKRLKTYLKIDKKTESILIQQISLPKDQNIFFAHFENCMERYDNAANSGAQKATNLKDRSQTNKWSDYFFENHSDTIHIISSYENKEPSLCINNCGMYGSIELGNRCSKCFAQLCSLSDKTPKTSPEQNHKPKNENVPWRLSPRVIPQLSIQDYKKEKSQSFLFPQHDILSPGSDDETVLISVKPKVRPQFKDMIGVVTCVTSGCFGEGQRKLQYRCATCYVSRPNVNEAAVKPVQNENDFRTAVSSSLFSEKPVERLPKMDTAAANFGGINPVNRTKNATLFTELGSEDTQVSLLELLCSNNNCPNRRESPLHSLCPSCSKMSSHLCCTPGCNNEQGQNSLGMCNNCYRLKKLNQQKIPTIFNTTSHIFAPEHFPVNNGRKKCDKPQCINSGGIHCTGYCIKCYTAIENQEYAEPSAPTFHN